MHTRSMRAEFQGATVAAAALARNTCNTIRQHTPAYEFRGAAIAASVFALLYQQLRQYLHFCTSKESKQSSKTWRNYGWEWGALVCHHVQCICTFVPLKRVNWVVKPGGTMVRVSSVRVSSRAMPCANTASQTDEASIKGLETNIIYILVYAC